MCFKVLIFCDIRTATYTSQETQPKQSEAAKGRLQSLQKSPEAVRTPQCKEASASTPPVVTPGSQQPEPPRLGPNHRLPSKTEMASPEDCYLIALHLNYIM